MIMALNYLRSKEWSMGCGGGENKGQCPECHGVSVAWLGDGHPAAKEAGHKGDCLLARAIKELDDELGELTGGVLYIKRRI